MKKYAIVIFVLIGFLTHAANPYRADYSKPKKIKGMNLVWNEEFNKNGFPDSVIWSYETGFVRNNELQWYKKENAFCNDGLLIIESRREKFENPNFVQGSNNWRLNRKYVEYTSSSINTRNSGKWLYGRFLVRARIDTTMGSWPAIWTLGYERPWPENGEIDMMEFYRVNNVPTILANVAWGTDKRYVAKWDGEKIELNYFILKDKNWVSKFHIWRMDWDKESIKLYLDDELLNECKLENTLNNDGTNPFLKPQYLLLNLAIGSNGGNPKESKFPIKYEVDYVRIYQY